MVAAPLPDDELQSRADLVVEARVLSRNGHRATINVKRVVKGSPRWQPGGWLHWLGLRRTVLVRYESQPINPVLGDWWNEDAFIPGNRVRAHLFWDDAAQCYAAVWWNGIDVLY